MSEIVLETKNLGIAFGGLKAVENLNIRIEEKQIYGLIGPNGAGKTTAFNMLTGVYKPTLGTIGLCGEDITGLSAIQINRKGMARTFQNIRLFNNMSVIRNVLVGMHNQKEYRCNFFESVFRLPKHFRNHLASNLPYGKQRKLEIARALASNPKILLLDEPAAGMNPNETRELMDTIRLLRDEMGLTILLIEHDMKLVSGICDELTVLNFGQTLAQGDTKAVLNDPEVVKAYLGGE